MRTFGIWEAFPAPAGESTCWGRVYRGAFPRPGLGEAQRQALLQAGVTTVLDLRSAAENASLPHPLAGDRRFSLLRDSPDDFASIAPDLPMPRVYQAYLTQGAPHYRAIFEAIDRAEGAVLIHCFSGKDRTGMVAALLLEPAGVDGADIGGRLSGQPHLSDRPEAHRIPSNPENMVAYLALLGQYGGAANSSASAAGFPETL